MGNFTYLRHDQNDYVSAVLTVSSENVTYPKANSQALPISKPFRFTGCTSENIQIDLGSAKSIDLFALVNHNLTSAATITVNGGSSANPDGSQYTTTITWRQYDAFKYLASVQTWRYWKLIFANSTNPDGYVQLGYVMLGNATEFTFNFQYGWQFEDRYENQDLMSEFGVPFVAELYYQKRFALRFGPLSAANMDILRTLYTGAKRNLNPTFWIPDSAVNDGYLVRFENQLARLMDFYHSADLEMIEESRGKKIAA